MSITAMKLALEALEWAEHLVETSENSSQDVRWAFDAALPALRAAIAQAEAEIKPLYFVQHPDGSHSVADPQPTAIQEAEACEPVAYQEFTETGEWFLSYGKHPTAKQNPLFLAAGAQPAPKQEPVAYLVYAKGSHKYMTLTFDIDKVPEIYKGGDVVALCAAGAQTKQVLENLDELSVGDSLFESWYASYVKEGAKGLKQHCRDAYAAGMGDPLVAPVQAQERKGLFIDMIAEHEGLAEEIAWKRKPLDDQRINEIYQEATCQSLRPQDYRLAREFARTIEQAHGIKEQP